MGGEEAKFQHSNEEHYLSQGAGGGEEEEKEVGGQVENEDYYVCKLPDCGAVIQFENCGARSKILNHYTSHFQRELEQNYSHLLTAKTGCTLCGRDLKGAIKSKVWIHIGVTHAKTNEILQKKGIDPIWVDIRMKRMGGQEAEVFKKSKKGEEEHGAEIKKKKKNKERLYDRELRNKILRKKF